MIDGWGISCEIALIWMNVTRLGWWSVGWKLKNYGTRPNWVVSYIAHTKFYSRRPVFHSSGQTFTRIGERASASFPAWSISIGSGNGLVPSGNKPLPEPMLTQISVWYLYMVQCCPKTVVQSPNATHKWNGQPILVPWAVWHKTKFGSQKFGNQLWCLFVIYVIFSKMCSMWV